MSPQIKVVGMCQCKQELSQHAWMAVLTTTPLVAATAVFKLSALEKKTSDKLLCGTYTVKTCKNQNNDNSNISSNSTTSSRTNTLPQNTNIAVHEAAKHVRTCCFQVLAMWVQFVKHCARALRLISAMPMLFPFLDTNIQAASSLHSLHS